MKTAIDSAGVSSRHRIQNFESETLGGQVRRIGEERLINRSQRQFGPVLRQQHLAGARAENAVFREPRQTE